VAWVNHPEWIKTPSLPPGMGLQFVRFADGAQALLGKLLEGAP
jgi:hypothetical protein